MHVRGGLRKPEEGGRESKSTNVCQISREPHTHTVPSTTKEQETQSHVDSHVTSIGHLRVANANMKTSNQSQDIQVTGPTHNLSVRMSKHTIHKNYM